jgi:outer membrane protein assembly factor BamB
MSGVPAAPSLSRGLGIIAFLFGLGGAIICAQAIDSQPAPKPPVSGASAPPLHFRWSSGGVLVEPPLIAGGLVYLVSEDRSVTALDEGGRILYKSDFRLTAKARLAPGRGGALLVADADRLIRLNRFGRQSFSLRFPGMAELRPPAEGWDGRLFLAGGAELACVSVSGALKWRASLPAAVVSGPLLLSDGRAVLGLADGSLRSYGPFSDERLLSPPAKSPVLSLAEAEGTLAFLRTDGTLYALDDQGAALAIAQGVKAFCRVEEKPLWAVLYKSGGIEALDSTGARAWKADAPASYDSILSMPGRVYLLGKSGLAALNASGAPLKDMRIANNAVPPRVSEGGIVYAGGLDWILYAYRFDAERLRDYGPAEGAAGSASAAGKAGGSYGVADFDRETLELMTGIDEEAAQASLLFDVEKSLESATIGAGEPDSVAVCAAIALSRADALTGRAAKNRGLYPLQRERACALLGRLGSTECREALARVIAQDDEDAVRAAAARALGSIGWDGDGYSLDTLERYCGRGYAPGSERLLEAACAAIGEIALFEGPSDRGASILLRILEYPCPPFIRAAALKALRSLMPGRQGTG